MASVKEAAARREFADFAEFYPYYMTQHRSRLNRFCHAAGLVAGFALLGAFFITGRWWLLALAPVAGYAMSWVGHFCFERNRPATFGYPLYSLRGDLQMFRDAVFARSKK